MHPQIPRIIIVEYPKPSPTENQIKMTIDISSSTLISLGSSCSGLSSEPAGPPGSDETNLLARWSVTPDCARVTNVLVVTSSVRMLNGVHGHTTHLRPAVPLHSELVVSIASLEKGLLCSASTSNLPDHCSAATWHYFLRPRWKLDSEVTQDIRSFHSLKSYWTQFGTLVNMLQSSKIRIHKNIVVLLVLLPMYLVEEEHTGFCEHKSCETNSKFQRTRSIHLHNCGSREPTGIQSNPSMGSVLQIKLMIVDRQVSQINLMLKHLKDMFSEDMQTEWATTVA